jgi:hypothetical protein
VYLLRESGGLSQKKDLRDKEHAVTSFYSEKESAFLANENKCA